MSQQNNKEIAKTSSSSSSSSSSRSRSSSSKVSEFLSALFGLLLIAAFFGYFVWLNGGTFAHSASRIYNYITTPVTSIALQGDAIGKERVVNCTGEYINTQLFPSALDIIAEEYFGPEEPLEHTERFCNLSTNTSFTSLFVSSNWSEINRFVGHDNAIIKLLTFYNKESLENLNLAYRLGISQKQYSLYMFDDENKAVFLGSATDGPSMLLYTFTWIVNAPQKIVSEALAVIFASKEFKQLTRSHDGAVCVFVALALDFLVGLVGYFLDLWLALGNAVVGGIIGLVMHPLNSLCSILGMVYFGAFAIWSGFFEVLFAIWQIF